MNSKISIYGAGTLRTLRVLWALEELSLTYEHQEFLPRSGYSQSPGYLDINLTGKIPSAEIDGIVLNESAAICLHLFDRYSNDRNLDDLCSAMRAKLYQWCFYAMTELDSHTLYILAKHGGQLKDFYGESDVAVTAATIGFEHQIEKLTRELSDGREFVIPSGFSVADILIGTCIESATKLSHILPLEIPDLCIQYWENLKSRRPFRDAFSANYRAAT